MLQPILATALDAMNQHPHHTLTLGRRHAIYAALGPRATTPTVHRTIGHVRRADLAIRAVRHIAPIWELRRPHDSTVQQVLIAMERFQHGGIDIHQLQRDWWDLDAYMDMILDANIDEDDHTHAMVGLAAARALDVVIRDDIFEPDHANELLNVGDVAFFNRDTPFFALSAYVNPRLVHQGQVALYDAKVQEFWTWWLTEAAPAAWSSGAEALHQ